MIRPLCLGGVNMAEFIRPIIGRRVQVLSIANNGWQKELNFVSWNSNPEKLEIRNWAPDHARMSKGVTFTREEARALLAGLEELKDLGEI